MLNNNIQENKKDNSTRIISVAALIVSILCLAIGFAAYSSTLVIKPNVNVKPSDNVFRVGFSTEDRNIVEGTVVPKKNEGADASSATLKETTITGVSATFNASGQSVEYSFYVNNVGAYDAYLNNILFKYVNSANSNKVCKANQGTTQSLVDDICKYITLGIKITGDDFSFNDYQYTSLTNLSNELLRKGKVGNILVKISYLPNNALIDGPFTVDFGDISLNFDAID